MCSNKINYEEINKQHNLDPRKYLVAYALTNMEMNVRYLSYNDNISLDYIKETIHYPWDWNVLSYNPNITMEFIEENIEKNWNWNRLSSNENISIEFVKKFQDKPWNWQIIFNKKFEKDENLMRIKNHQIFIQENIWEELVKKYMHPNRINMLLEMGYELDDIDNIL